MCGKNIKERREAGQRDRKGRLRGEMKERKEEKEISGKGMRRQDEWKEYKGEKRSWAKRM